MTTDLASSREPARHRVTARSRPDPPTALVVQHLPHEHAAVLGEALVLGGWTTTTWRAWCEPTPALRPADVAAVVVLGGDMNTDEGTRWPHLAIARELLGEALAAAVPAMGICLGAQLLAEAAGGHVTHGVPEVGWLPITATPSGRTHPVIGVVPDETAWFSAHGDQIALPPAATLLAFGDATPVQAFTVGSGLGLQFHPEVDASAVAGYVGIPGIEGWLAAAGWQADDLVAEARRRNAAHRAAGAALFTAWLRTAAG